MTTSTVFPAPVNGIELPLQSCAAGGAGRNDVSALNTVLEYAVPLAVSCRNVVVQIVIR